MMKCLALRDNLKVCEVEGCQEAEHRSFFEKKRWLGRVVTRGVGSDICMERHPWLYNWLLQVFQEKRVVLKSHEFFDAIPGAGQFWIHFKKFYEAMAKTHAVEQHWHRDLWNMKIETFWNAHWKACTQTPEFYPFYIPVEDIIACQYVPYINTIYDLFQSFEWIMPGVGVVDAPIRAVFQAKPMLLVFLFRNKPESLYSALVKRNIPENYADQIYECLMSLRCDLFEYVRERCDTYKEELMMRAWHPDRVSRMIEEGGWEAIEGC